MGTGATTSGGWYCRDAQACTQRWTTSRRVLSADGEAPQETAPGTRPRVASHLDQAVPVSGEVALVRSSVHSGARQGLGARSLLPLCGSGSRLRVLLLAARYNGWATAASGQQDKSVAGLAQLPKNMSTERTDPHPGPVDTAQDRARLRA